MKIALDVMGGDHAPDSNLAGLAQALRDYPDVERFLLVGDRAVVVPGLERFNLSPADPRLELVQASQVVAMSDPSVAALRAKKDSSITVGAGLIKDGLADALVSAGHTGAAVAAMVVKTRTLPGIDRPGIAAVFPSPSGEFVVLDVGANVGCKPEHLAQYAILGEAYSRYVLGVERPRVGLLSVGEEAGKGNELTRDAFRLLQQMPLDFRGNVEGNYLFRDVADVVVCDGFAGNAVLKSCEGLAKTMSEMLKASLRKSPMRMLGAWFSQDAFRELKELTDHEEYGGAPLLGINGNCIIAHGSSSPKAIRNAIRVTREMVRKDINGRIGERLAEVDWQELKGKAPQPEAGKA